MEIFILIGLGLLLFYVIKKGSPQRKVVTAFYEDSQTCKPHQWISVEQYLGEERYVLLQKVIKYEPYLVNNSYLPKFVSSLVCEKCGYLSGTEPNIHVRKDILLKNIDILILPYRKNPNLDKEHEEFLEMFLQKVAEYNKTKPH